MQKIRRTFYSPLTLTRFVVGAGLALFLLGVFLLQLGTAKADIATARSSFCLAGWVLTAGWLLKRIEDRQWPFSSRPANGSRHFSTIKRFATNILVIVGAVLGAMIWRSYGPLDTTFRNFIPRSYTVSANSQRESHVMSVPTDVDVLPLSYRALSLAEYGSRQQVFATTPRGLPNDGSLETGEAFPFGHTLQSPSVRPRFDSAAITTAP